jgi:hypothetical protein
MKQKKETTCNCFKWAGEGEGGRGRDNGGDATNVHYKSNWNCLFESHHKKYILIKKKRDHQASVPPGEGPGASQVSRSVGLSLPTSLNPSKLSNSTWGCQGALHHCAFIVFSKAMLTDLKMLVAGNTH